MFNMSSDYYEMLNDDGTGLCTGCGQEAYGVEPDARRYECEYCGLPLVYGVEELLLMGKINITEDDE
jgi:hypothetical protein